MTWNSVERFAFPNISANPPVFILRGGQYGIDAVGTFTSVALEKLGGDNVTWVPVMTPFTGVNAAVLNLPSGTYRLNVAATAAFVVVTSIVTTM
jgi:hypothetical protein